MMKRKFSILLFPLLFICTPSFLNAKDLVTFNLKDKVLNMSYKGVGILSASFNQNVYLTSEISGVDTVKQNFFLKTPSTQKKTFYIYTSDQGIAAETKGNAQKRFPLVRTSHGQSLNLRNNAIYDRKNDWMIQFPEDVIITPVKCDKGDYRYEVETTADKFSFTFYPDYYRVHKGLTYFTPQKYNVYKGSVTGWCSWWAYQRNYSENEHQKLLKVWSEKHFSDYGYRFIQIDDTYCGGKDANRKFSSQARDYYGGRPETWLDWQLNRFPRGLYGYVSSVKSVASRPGVWVGCYFSDKTIADEHPDWFICDKNGKPAEAPFVSYVLDLSKEEAVEELVRPTFKSLKNAGVEYLKIDQLRHYMYDMIHNHLDWFENRGINPDSFIRKYLSIAREELGEETFILACWGVLPETIGIVDACRLGGDGYGPVSLQQYNSWNGIVWRNDPDHCDVLPDSAQSIIRPALASIAGAMLMLSDKPEVYDNDAYLRGLRCSSPVLFSVPGQLYDYDSKKTDQFLTIDRKSHKDGAKHAPTDADQIGEIAHFWMNGFNMSYGYWNVLHRINWSKDQRILKSENIKLADLGLDDSKEYLAYEFWGNKFLGLIKKNLKLGELKPLGLESIVIKEKLNRPQLLSTNRHLSHGAAEIEKLVWLENTLEGRSKIIADSHYEVKLYVPNDYKVQMVYVDDKPIENFIIVNNILTIASNIKQTTSLTWKVEFTKAKH